MIAPKNCPGANLALGPLVAIFGSPDLGSAATAAEGKRHDGLHALHASHVAGRKRFPLSEPLKHQDKSPCANLARGPQSATFGSQTLRTAIVNAAAFPSVLPWPAVFLLARHVRFAIGQSPPPLERQRSWKSKAPSPAIW